MIAPINPGQLPGAWRDLPSFVGGKTFASLSALKQEIGSGHAVIRPGDKFSVRFPQTAGGGVPQVQGFNKNSPFTAKYAHGKITFTAKPGAKLGTIDRLTILQAPVVGPNARPIPTRTNVTLEVGLGRIRMG
jgi:hypothetical protein